MFSASIFRNFLLKIVIFLSILFSNENYIKTMLCGNGFEVFLTLFLGVVVVSWYPPGRSDAEGRPADDLYPVLLDTALETDLLLTFHIEPFENRTAITLKQAFQHLHTAFGSHPALYKPRGGGGKPLFYVYDSYQVTSAEWARVLKPSGDFSIRATDADCVVLGLILSTSDVDEIQKSGLDGAYTYFASNSFTQASTWSYWRRISFMLHQRGLLFSPSVGPGYLDTRIRPWNSANSRSRDGGRYYEDAWQKAVEAGPDFLSITSYNEWGEGTQIEGAKEASRLFEGYGTDPMMYMKLTKKLIDNSEVG